MTTIGTIQETNTNGFKEMKGQISTLHLNISFKLIPNKQKSNPNDPSYSISTASLNGIDVQIGSVWEKSCQNSDDVFLSMTFDDPSFNQPLNVAAFENNPNRWDIVWRRRQVQQNQNETA
jgi:uncharacterized protein (DUF736 family)